jgi:hypothetical protein
MNRAIHATPDARPGVLMFVLVAAMVLVAASARAGTRAEPSQIPAMWAHHAVIVDLHDLPRAYTCNDLWYKFKDVLTALGAGPGMKILPYQCGNTPNSNLHSPKVQVEFSTVTSAGSAARWATLRAVRKPVQLKPATLPHFDAQDCELLNQIQAALLDYLGDATTTARLTCNAPASSKASYGLTVLTLVPVGKT